MQRLLYCCLSPLVLWFVSTATAGSVSPEAVVATFGDTPIYAEEMSLHIRDNVALVAVHFKTRHKVDLSVEGWEKKMEGETALELLKERSVQASRVSKAIQRLALRHGVGEPLPFPRFAQACDEINQTRSEAKATGQTLYGLVKFSPAQLYKYQLTNMSNRLRDRHLQLAFDQRKIDLQAAIEAEVAAMPVKLNDQIMDRLLSEQISTR